jgi:hypothetical protein
VIATDSLTRAAALITTLFAALVVMPSGCGTRDRAISVSNGGFFNIRLACSLGGNNGCDLGKDHPRVGGSTLLHSLQGKLLLLDAAGAVRESSACFQIPPCPDDGKDNGQAWSACMAAELNQALDGAFPNGLTYPGLADPDAVVLMLPVYDGTASNRACAEPDLIACAGLDFGAGASDAAFDVSCASCSGQALAPPTRTCPFDVDHERCFAERCQNVLVANGL